MSTAIKDVVESPRAVKALAEAGYVTIDDLDGVPVESLATLKGVGQVTLDALLRAKNGPEPEAPVEEPQWDEGPHPIHLDSPVQELALRLTEAGEERQGRRVRVINPIFLEFKGGEAQLRRKDYLLAKYSGDRAAAKAESLTDAPWRLDAIRWLQAKPGYNKSFFILTD